REATRRMSKTYDTWQVWQDAQIAGRFTSQRRGAIVGATEQFETMLSLIHYVRRSPLRLLDIGCGDGIVLETVANAHPLARGGALSRWPAGSRSTARPPCWRRPGSVLPGRPFFAARWTS